MVQAALQRTYGHSSELQRKLQTVNKPTRNCTNRKSIAFSFRKSEIKKCRDNRMPNRILLSSLHPLCYGYASARCASRAYGCGVATTTGVACIIAWIASSMALVSSGCIASAISVTTGAGEIAPSTIVRSSAPKSFSEPAATQP